MSWKECHQTPSQSHKGWPRILSLARYCFLYNYINDLPNCVNSSTIRLFTDDCLIYKEIHAQQDTEALQTVLDAWQTWVHRWLMSFRPQKCQLLLITRKSSIAQYNIHGHVLEVAETATYTGVMRHLDINDVLQDAQHGFRKRRSCETQLLLNTLSAKDGDLRLSASNACLPKTEISVFVTECVFFTSTCYKLHMFTLHDVLYS